MGLVNKGHAVEVTREARECVGRRTVAMAEWVRMRQEAAAYHAAHIRGRGRWGSARGPATKFWFIS